MSHVSDHRPAYTADPSRPDKRIRTTRDPEPAKPDVQPCVLGHPLERPAAADIGLVCRRHYNWINDVLSQLLELYALLPDVLLPGPSLGGGGGRSKVIGSPAPGRLDAMAVTDRRGTHYVDPTPEEGIMPVPDVPGALDTWARLAAEDRDPDDTFGLDGTLMKSIAFLRRERHWIARQNTVEDYAADLATLHRALAQAVGDSPWPRKLGKCPTCGRPLHNVTGMDALRCARCHVTWTGRDLARLRLIHEQEEAKR